MRYDACLACKMWSEVNDNQSSITTGPRSHGQMWLHRRWAPCILALTPCPALCPFSFIKPHTRYPSDSNLALMPDSTPPHSIHSDRSCTHLSLLHSTPRTRLPHRPWPSPPPASSLYWLMRGEQQPKYNQRGYLPTKWREVVSGCGRIQSSGDHWPLARMRNP